MTVWRAADIENRLPSPLSDAEEELIDGGLGDLVQAELARFLRRPLELATFTGELHMLDGFTPYITLRNTPVIGVSAVAVQDALNPSNYQTLDAQSFVADLSGIHVAWFWPSLGSNEPAPAIDPWIFPVGVKVTYTAGLSDLVAGYDAIRSVLAARLARIVSKRREGLGEEVTQLGVEGYTVSVHDDGFLPAELDLLRDLRRKVLR